MRLNARFAFFISLGVAQAVIFNGTTLIEEYVCEHDGRISGVCTQHGDCKQPATEQGDCGVQDLNIICCSSDKSSPWRTGMRNRERCAEYSSIGRVGQCPPLRPLSGSSEVVPGELPYMVALGYRKEGDEKVQWRCTGALISVRYVLTTHTCVRGQSYFGGEPQVARLGSLHLDSKDGIEIGIVKYVPQPLSTPDRYYYDIGLLKLERDVYISTRVRPACLHAEFNIPATRAVMAAWGRTETGDSSWLLKKVVLPLVPYSVCREAYKDREEKTSLFHGIDNITMFCAGEIRGENYPCLSNTGAPLVMKLSKPYCAYSIIGLASFGPRMCGSSNKTWVYTRVSSYVPWIESVVWPY